MDYSILVGGEAGQGMDTFADCEDLKRYGYMFFTHLCMK